MKNESAYGEKSPKESGKVRVAVIAKSLGIAFFRFRYQRYAVGKISPSEKVEEENERKIKEEDSTDKNSSGK